MALPSPVSSKNRQKLINPCVNTFQESFSLFSPTKANLHEKHSNSRKLPLKSILFLFAALALQACGGSSSSNFEQDNPVPPLENATTGNDEFGSDGVAAFRLLTNNNGFDLNEGEGTTLPITVQRVNGHQSDITLSTREDQGGANSLLQVSLNANQLVGDAVDTTLTASFALDTRRAAEQQRAVIVTASDGTQYGGF